MCRLDPSRQLSQRKIYVKNQGNVSTHCTVNADFCVSGRKGQITCCDRQTASKHMHELHNIGTLRCIINNCRRRRRYIIIIIIIILLSALGSKDPEG